MKKQANTPVDEYVRQREPEIPVTFDPEDWNRLAAALDATAVPQPERTVPPPAPKPKSFRGIKGWWVSGIWVLALLSLTWALWQRVGHTHAVSEMPVETEKPETEALAPAPSAPVAPSPKSSGAAPGLNTPADQYEPPADAAQTPDAVPYPSDLPGYAGRPEATALNQAAALSADSIRRLPALPADSARTEKKKKHLFW